MMAGEGDSTTTTSNTITEPTQSKGSLESDVKQGKQLTDAGFAAFKQGRLEDAIAAFSEGLDLMYPSNTWARS
jgi:hypothetical protein